MRVLYLSFWVVVADQLTKLIVKGVSLSFLGIKWKGMFYGESFNVIGDFFRITFVENPGMAFGLDFGIVYKFFLSLFSILAAFGLTYYIYRSRHRDLIFRLSLALILGGAVGNLIDRVFYGVFYGYAPLMYGKVVDFLDVDFFDFSLFGHFYSRWPIFNIADTSVSVGVVLLLFSNGTKKNKKLDEEFEEEEIDNYKKLKDLETQENYELANGKDNYRENI